MTTIRRLARWLGLTPSGPAGERVPADMLLTGDVIDGFGRVLIIRRRGDRVLVRTAEGAMLTLRRTQAVVLTHRMPF